MEWPSIQKKELYCDKDLRGLPFRLADSSGDGVVAIWEDLKRNSQFVQIDGLTPPFPTSVQGKVLVLEFFATWCKNCISASPLFNAIVKQFKEDVVVVSISLEELPTMMQWVNDTMMFAIADRGSPGVDYLVASEPTGKYINGLIIKGVPHTFVISSDGIVRWQGVPNHAKDPDPLSIDVVRNIVACNRSPPVKNATFMPVTEELTFSAQPSVAQLKNLNMVGIRSVLNLRCTDEAGFVPNEDKLITESIQYHQLPIRYINDVNETNVNTLLSTVAALPKPLLIHCNVGLCACAAALLHIAQVENGKNPGAVTRGQVLQWAADLGFKIVDQPQFYEFLGRYLGN